MDLKLNCDYNGFDNVRFAPRNMEKGILVDVTREYESESILLGDKDVDRLYEYLGEYIGKDKQSVPEKPSLNLDEASSELQHNFYCATDDGSHLLTGYDISDNQLTLDLTEDSITNYIYLKAEDAIKLSESITKVFGTDQNNPEPHYMRPFKAESVVEEYEAASKADLENVVADLDDLKEDFRGSMESVAKDWSKLNKDLNQVHVEISQIQNDIFNTNESTKVKLESLEKHIEGVSKEVVAAMEHLATRIDENGEEIQSLKVQEGIRKMKSRSLW